jgi:hypothetical protein
VKKTLILILISFTLITSYAQPVTFEKKYGGGNDDFGESIIKLSDGYLLAGYTGSFGAGGYDVYAIKIDLSGNLIWHKTYGGPLHDYCYRVIHTSDGGFAFFGWTEEVINGMSGLMIVKTDSLGNEQWRKTYGGASGGSGGVETINGGYLITGNTSIPKIDIYIAKTDSAGNLLWNNTIGGSYQQHISSDVIELPQIGFLIVGYMKTCLTCDPEGLILQINYNGDSLKMTPLQSINNMGAVTLGGIENINNEIIIVGWDNSFSSASYNIVLIKLNELGEEKWKEYILSPLGQIYLGADVKGTMNNDYVLCGGNAGNSFISKTDSSGNLIWTKDFGFPVYFDVLLSIATADDGGFIALGTATDSNFPYNEFYVVKTDSSGVVTSIMVLNYNDEIHVFPNPSLFGEYVNIKMVSGVNYDDIEIFDFLGRKINYNLTRTGNLIKIKDLPPGNHLLKVTDKNGKEVHYNKLLILKP